MTDYAYDVDLSQAKEEAAGDNDTVELMYEYETEWNGHPSTEQDPKFVNYFLFGHYLLLPQPVQRNL